MNVPTPQQQHQQQQRTDNYEGHCNYTPHSLVLTPSPRGRIVADCDDGDDEALVDGVNRYRFSWDETTAVRSRDRLGQDLTDFPAPEVNKVLEVSGGGGSRSDPYTDGTVRSKVIGCGDEEEGICLLEHLYGSTLTNHTTDSDVESTVV